MEKLISNMRRLFVISDLHLGGRPDERNETGHLVRTGFQICHAYAELVAFVDWVASLAPQADDGSEAEEIELVINGDIVDYLADDDFPEPTIGAQIWTIDDAHAVTKLERIAERTRGSAQRGIFEALKDFLGAGHRLTLILGNHDVELSLPAVRQRLLALLGGESTRLRFIYDGEAYTIGRVLIEHGNRYDRWNMLNYSTLRQERSVRSRRLPINEADRADNYFMPPAGTHLVIRFMNRIKSRYRFIDLLKPETETVIPLLLALEPQWRATLDDILSAVGLVQKYLAHDLQDAGFLRMTEVQTRLDALLHETLGADAELFVPSSELADDEAFHDPRTGEGTRGQMSLRDRLHAAVHWLSERYDQFEETLQSASKIAHEIVQQASQLASIRRAQDWEVRVRQLHVALRALSGTDRSFDITHEAPAYLDAARTTALRGRFEVIIYGHTHLPKRVPLYRSDAPAPEECPTAVYFNTGTWCDVMRLPEDLAAPYKQVKQPLLVFFQAISCNDFSRYVKRYLSFVELVVDPGDEGHVQEAHLYSYCGHGRERSAPLSDCREP
jgi:UDP-2,3-diacylglucosamine pyrophosphatase LpxH